MTKPTATNSWDYAVDLTYDANGNIETLKRNATGASASGQMDNLTYDYYDETDVGYNRKTNRLKQVADAVSAGSYSVDIDDQVTPGHTYDYDGIGNLIFDDQEEVAEIKWTTYGRIAEVIRESGSTKEDVEYLYDAMQNRVAKIVKPKDQGTGALLPETDWVYTYYLRDAQGNILATYDKTNDGDDNLHLKEQMLYGSDRVGLLNRNLLVATSGTTAIASDALYRKLSQKQYELSNHLGNILTTVDGRRIAQDPDVNTTIDYFEASVTSANDYYPFGMLMIGRNFSVGSYRFGFQSQEMDNEVKGNGNSIYFKYRIHDVRLGRFLSVDPLYKDYPFYSTYTFSGNTLIFAVEIEGLEPGRLFSSQDKAADNWGKYYNDNSIRRNREYASYIYTVTNNGETYWVYTVPKIGTQSKSQPNHPDGGEDKTAYIHSHSAYRDASDNNFSGTVNSSKWEGNDIGRAKFEQVDAYVTTPMGALFKYDYSENKTQPVNYTQPSDPNDPINNGMPSDVENNPGAPAIYVIKPGDSPESISIDFNKNIKTILKDSGLKRKKDIKIGAEIIITD